MSKATGEDGKDGDSIKITQDENNVYFELADGTIITIARSNKTEEGDTQIIQFKDAKVKAICVQNWDTNDDDELSYGEAAKVTSIRKFFRGTTIQSFDELQYFTGIDEIGTDAFSNCSKLKEIYCTPTNPPTLDGNTVFSSIASNAVFYVPSASVNNYKTADEWKAYADQIVGYDF
ncbi:hypothetical protein [Alistipes communis]|uniref:hypothetical protein n=1 Tax=Alistipes communis TaxID=2585118 RepID=UPI00035FD29E